MSVTDPGVFLRRVRDELGKLVLPSVLPILTVDGGRSDVVGTGTFFLLGDSAFLVTAAHLLRKIIEGPTKKERKAGAKRIKLFIPEKAESGRHVEGDVAYPEDWERYDIGCIRLPREQAMELKALGFAPVRASAIRHVHHDASPAGGYNLLYVLAAPRVVECLKMPQLKPEGADLSISAANAT